MLLTDRLADWRDPEHWDDDPTEEQVLQQFLYSAITDFIEQKSVELNEILHNSEGDYDALANTFVNEYAAP